MERQCEQVGKSPASIVQSFIFFTDYEEIQLPSLANASTK
jgi:hypothetical protein